MPYTKTERKQLKHEKRFSYITYPECAIGEVNQEDLAILPILVKALTELHVDHFNRGQSREELSSGTTSSTRRVALAVNYFGITKYVEDKSNPSYYCFKQIISNEEVESFVADGELKAIDIAIALSVMAEVCDFLGLSKTTFLFSPEKTDQTLAYLVEMLLGADYLHQVGGKIQWTAKIAPYMLMWNWYEGEINTRLDPLGEFRWMA